MSYIEIKYRNKISEIFEHLSTLDDALLEQLNKKSVKLVNEIAKLCADFNGNINIILKKYYPEIRQIADKLKIKSFIKFYFDLIDNLTDLIRNIENFQKIDEEYYKKLIEFINEKENLITGKYKTICSQELAVFYDPVSRENLETILKEKFEKRNREFFTFGSLEEEIKKIAKHAGANQLRINSAENLVEGFLFESAQSVIRFGVALDDEQKLKKIGGEIKKYLESKGYKAKLVADSIITNAKLLPDKP